MRPLSSLAAMVAAMLLSACAGPPALIGMDGAACVGEVAPVPGLRAVAAPAAVREAKGAPGKGGLCDGRAYVADAPVTLYRVWDASRPFSEFGVWWALEAPSGPRETYRLKYAICPGWSALDRVIVCTIQPGSTIVLGPGQSAECDGGAPALPATTAVQVYFPPQAAHLQACSSSTNWP